MSPPIASLPIKMNDSRRNFHTRPMHAALSLFAAIVLAVAGSAYEAYAQDIQSKAPPTVVFMTDFGVVYFVLPDNGLMTLVQDRDGIEAAREITNRDWMIGAALSSTFHGRDIFSPVGAHVAHGEDWNRVGPEVAVNQLIRLDLTASKLDERGLSGAVIATDGPFGNLVTNINGEDFLKLDYGRGQNVHLTIGKTEMNIPFVRTFSDVALKKPLLYIDSRGHVGLAVNQGSFVSTYDVKVPAQIFISRHSK
jgi:S-adenosylmethionine hydrolase